MASETAPPETITDPFDDTRRPTGPDGASAAPPATRIGRYDIVEIAGRGAMGVVYRARDRELRRDVGLKLMAPVLLQIPEARDRAMREAQAMARIDHPNVVKVYEVGDGPDGLYIAMEWLAGGTLRQWMEQSRPWRETLAMFRQAGEGLRAAHEAGLIHRDFKPANVMLSTRGEPRVSDFGLVRSEQIDVFAPAGAGKDRAGEAPGVQTLTETGGVIGTPAYMAPEQLRGGRGDERSDQFAFAVSFWEALFGRRPFVAAAGEKPLESMVLAMDAGAPPAPRGSPVPWRLVAALQRALHRDADRRWPSMAAMLRELSTIDQRRNRVVAIGVVAALLAGVGIAYAAAGRSSVRTDPGCPPAATKLAGVWDAETRARVGARYEAGAEHIRDTWRGHANQFDAQAAAWTTMWNSACRSADRTDDPLLHGQRVTCLDSRLVELRAYVNGLSDPAVDVDAFAQSSLGTFQLQSVEECSRPEVLRAQMPPPPASVRPQVDAKLAEARALLVKLRMHDQGGLKIDSDSIFARMTELQREVLDLGYLSGAAEIGYIVADQLARVRSADGDTMLLAVAELNERTRDDLQLARTLALIVNNRALRLPDYDPAGGEEMLTRATTLAGRVGNPDSVLAVIATARAKHATRTMNYPAAVQAYTDAIAARQRLGQTSHALISREALATLQSWNGEARSAATEAHAIIREREALGGPWHMQLVRNLNGLATVYARAGEFEAALAAAERATQILERVVGPKPSTQTVLAHSLGLRFAFALGNRKSAEAHLRATVAGDAALGFDLLGDYGSMAFNLRAEGHRDAAAFALELARDVPGSKEGRARVEEGWADLIVESGEPFGDANWAERLDGLPNSNYHTTMAIIEARGGRERAAFAHVDAITDDLGVQRLARAMALMELHRYAEAVPALQEAWDIFDGNPRWDDRGIMDTPVHLGVSLLESGNPAAAIAPLEAAIWRAGGCCGAGGVMAQEARFALARALTETGGDPLRAAALAREAHRRLAAMGPRLAIKTKKVEAWLLAHELLKPGP